MERYRTPDETRTVIESYESEIADLKTRLLLVVNTKKKEKVPMKQKTRTLLAVAGNIVVDSAMLLTYGTMYGTMTGAMQTCAGIAMGISGIGALITGIAVAEDWK